MMKKEYLLPTALVTVFSENDVIRTSDEDDGQPGGGDPGVWSLKRINIR